MLKRIHINQHVIRSNKKIGGHAKCISVKTSKSNDYAHEVDIEGSCRVVYRPDDPLPCGAVVWIEVEDGVPIILRDNYPDNPYNNVPLMLM